MKLFKHGVETTRSRPVAMPTIGLLLLAVVGFALAFASAFSYALVQPVWVFAGAAS